MLCHFGGRCAARLLAVFAEQPHRLVPLLGCAMDSVVSPCCFADVEITNHILGIGLVVVGALLLLAGYCTVLRAKAVARWHRTVGVIVGQRFSSEADEEEFRCESAITYEYQVNGRRYRGNAVMSSTTSEKGVAEAQAKHAEGTAVDVRYCPRDVGDSTVAPPSMNEGLGLVLGGIAMTVAGIVIWFVDDW